MYVGPGLRGERESIRECAFVTYIVSANLPENSDSKKNVMFLLFTYFFFFFYKVNLCTNKNGTNIVLWSYIENRGI